MLFGNAIWQGDKKNSGCSCLGFLVNMWISHHQQNTQEQQYSQQRGCGDQNQGPYQCACRLTYQKLQGMDHIGHICHWQKGNCWARNVHLQHFQTLYMLCLLHFISIYLYRLKHVQSNQFIVSCQLCVSLKNPGILLKGLLLKVAILAKNLKTSETNLKNSKNITEQLKKQATNSKQ